VDTIRPNSTPLAVEFFSPFYLHHGDSLGTLLVSHLWLETTIIHGRDPCPWHFLPKINLVLLMALWRNQLWRLLNILHGIGAITRCSHGFSIMSLKRYPPASSTSSMLKRCGMTSRSVFHSAMDLEFFSYRKLSLLFLRAITQ
jgi:hypothetical protein